MKNTSSARSNSILGLIASLTLHISIFLLLTHLLAFGGAQGGQKDGDHRIGNKYGGVDVKVIEKERPTEISIVQAKTVRDSDIVVKNKKKIPRIIIKDCPHPTDWYGGIGLKESNGLITEIFKGYAAEGAGLLVGDIIIGTGGDQIMGTPGTAVNLTVMRNGAILSFKIMRVKVCFNRG